MDNSREKFVLASTNKSSQPNRSDRIFYFLFFLRTYVRLYDIIYVLHTHVRAPGL